MAIAVIAIILIFIGCLIYACIKNTDRDVVIPCSAPENGDVGFDTACERHLKLSNSELPASLESNSQER